MPISSVTYEGDKLIAGPVITRDNTPLAADTYYRGMPLELVPTVTAGTNTGTGLCAVVSGKPTRTFIVQFTAALVVKIIEGTTDILTGIAITAGTGSRTLITYAGATVSIDVTATAFVSGDKFTVAPGTTYTYTATNPEAIYLGPSARVLSAPGVGSAIIGGEIDGDGLVTDANAVLTVTEQMRQLSRLSGIFIK